MTKTIHAIVLSSRLYFIAPDAEEDDVGMTSVWVAGMSDGHLVSAL